MRNFQCLWCERFRSNDKNPTCDAFPKGIPIKLWFGEVSHEESFKGDNGLLFEPVKKILRK